MTSPLRQLRISGARSVFNLFWFLGPLTVALLSEHSAFAADPLPLSIEVEPSSYLSRTAGPYPLNLILRWSGSGLLEGRLKIDVRDEDELKCTLLSDDLVLNRGEERRSWLIPRTGSPLGLGQLTLEMTWLHEGVPKWRVTHPLRIPGEMRRTVVIGLCAESTKLHQEIVDALSIEKVLPFPEDDENRPVVTLAPFLAPADLPHEPLELCTNDVLLLSERELRSLIPSQKQAIAAWVRAGGAAVIVANDFSWRSDEVEFVRELFSGRPDLTVLPKDSGGLQIAGDDESSVVTAQHGFGVVALMLSPAAALKDANLCRETASALWRTRSPQLFNVNNFGGPGYPVALNRPATPEMRGLVDDLLPRGVRVVPLTLIAAVLAAYVLLVGPFDYYVLGWIRRRKWTWITFPLLTLAVAGGALIITRQYLKVHGPPRSVVFKDVLPDGTVARQTRLSVLFEVVGGESVSPLPRGLFYSYGPELMQQDRAQLASMGLPMPEPMQYSPPVLEGRMPHAMKARQELPERVPFLHRQLSIPLESDKEAPVPGFDWQELPEVDSSEFLPNLRESIRTAFGPSATAYVFRAGNRTTVCGQSTLFQSLNRANVFIQGMPPGVAVPQPAIRMGGGMNYAVERDFIDSTTSRDQGLFTYVSRISPACDPSLEDLTIFDSGDFQQLALVIAVPEEAGWIIYRRLYRRHSDGHWR